MHTDKVEKGTCSVCGYETSRTVVGTATHSFDTENWVKDETGHWHKSDCDATAPEHEGIKADFAQHTYGEWTKKTDASFHKNQVNHRFCTVCTFEDEQEVQDTMLHTWKWTTDAGHHWEQTTCTGHALIERNKAQHTYKYVSVDERTHKRATNCTVHADIFDLPEPHEYDSVTDTTCNKCSYVRNLDGKGSFNTIAEKTYSGNPQAISTDDYSISEAIKSLCEIQYKLASQDDSNYTTTPKTNAGVYTVRIYCRGDNTYLEGEVASAEFVIKQFEVAVSTFYRVVWTQTIENFIELDSYEASDASLAESYNLTLIASGEKFTQMGRYTIQKQNDVFEGLEFDDSNFKPIPKNSNGNFSDKVSIINYYDTAPVVVGTNQVEGHVVWIDFSSEDYVLIRKYDMQSGTLKIGDYLICEGINIPMKVLSVYYYNGQEANPTSMVLQGEKIEIKLSPLGLTEEICKTVLINNTLTRVIAEDLQIKESTGNDVDTTTSTVIRTLQVGESRYLGFKFTVEAGKKYLLRINPEFSPSGYGATFDFYSYNHSTQKTSQTLNYNGVYYEGGEKGTTYTFVIKCTRVNDTRIDHGLFGRFDLSST